MKPPFLRTEYNYDRDEASRDTGLACNDKTLTQQQFKDECDINILHARYLETGEMPQVLDGLSYGNFEGVFDFQTAMNAVRTAEGLFQQFPARIKNRFDNDPQKMLEFLGNDENRDEAIFLGLIQNPATLPDPALTPDKEKPLETRARKLPEENPQVRPQRRGTPPSQGAPEADEKS